MRGPCSGVRATLGRAVDVIMIIRRRRRMMVVIIIIVVVVVTNNDDSTEEGLPPPPRGRRLSGRPTGGTITIGISISIISIASISLVTNIINKYY